MRPFFLLFFLIPFTFLSSEEPRTSTLIVTYKTDHEGERLDRTRFWLKNEQHKQSLYPKGSTFVFDPENKTRMVVIDDLMPGNYTIEFIIPNRDGRFEDIPKRKVIIAEGDVVKVDQEIKTHKEKWNAPIKSIQPFTQAEPEILDKEPAAEPIVTQTSTQPVASEAPSQPIVKRAEDRSVGKLIVSYDFKDSPSLASDVFFRLITSEDISSTHPEKGKDTEVPLRSGKMVMIQNLSTGPYTIEFFLKNSDLEFPVKTFEIQKDRTKSIHQSLQAITTVPEENPSTEASPIEEHAHTLTLTANIPTAEFHLIHLDTHQEYHGKGREFSIEDLKPGSYRASYSSTDPFFVPPKPEIIRVKQGQVEEKEVFFRTLGKVKIHTNIPYSSVSITSMNQEAAGYKKEIIGGEVSIYLPEGNYRVTFKDVRDRKAPEPVDIQVTPLQTEEVNAYFSEASAYSHHHTYNSLRVKG